MVAPGERLLWKGNPRGIRGFLRPMDLFLLAFAAFAALFFVTGIAASAAARSRSGPGDFLVVALFPFVFFAIFFFGPRLFSIWREASGAEYMLTDRRVVIRTRRREVELDLMTLPYLELESSWLSGETIYFAQRNIYEGWGGVYGGSPAPALRGLQDARSVYRMISEARTALRQRS